MSGNPLEVYRKFDPKVIECYESVQASAFAEGALSPKVKLLIAAAIDVEHGAVQGAIALCQRAIKLGASKEEIVEAFRVRLLCWRQPSAVHLCHSAAEPLQMRKSPPFS